MPIIFFLQRYAELGTSFSKHFQGENDNDEGTFKPLRIINMTKSLKHNILVSITHACYDKFSILSHVWSYLYIYIYKKANRTIDMRSVPNSKFL